MKLSKWQETRIIQNSIAFLYTNNKQLESENNKQY